ncbi:MAG: Holliday junction resolvase RuvX [Clostridiales bacterium]|jgi:putative Holliday junction resolvase|nr:Holliday junction resolvase RuvX [Clostridiales bacterium]
MRIMGLDYGDRTIGVAVSDPLGYTAQGLCVMRHEGGKSLKQRVRELADLVREREIGAVVLGYPKMMNNTEGEQCRKTLDFKRKLEAALGLGRVPVYLADERLTTASANRVLTEGGLSRRERGKYVDSVAAALILQAYLDYNKKDRGD